MVTVLKIVNSWFTPQLDRTLFWTDLHKEYPRIEKCSMAGENHTRAVIFDIRNLKGGGWPNGLTVDLEQSRLYWVDARYMAKLLSLPGQGS